MSAEVVTGSGADRAAVAGLAQRLVGAWCRNDADTFAAQFTDDGTMILPGVYCTGRAEIREHMAESFRGAHRGSQITGQPLDLRFLSPTVAMLQTEGGTLGPGDIEVDPHSEVRATWLAVKHDGQWRLVAYQNSPRN